jgi:hypothetical protein
LVAAGSEDLDHAGQRRRSQSEVVSWVKVQRFRKGFCVCNDIVSGHALSLSRNQGKKNKNFQAIPSICKSVGPNASIMLLETRVAHPTN